MKIPLPVVSVNLDARQELGITCDEYVLVSVLHTLTHFDVDGWVAPAELVRVMKVYGWDGRAIKIMLDHMLGEFVIESALEGGPRIKPSQRWYRETIRATCFDDDRDDEEEEEKEA